MSAVKSIAALLLLAAASLPAWPEAPKCKLVKIAEWPVRFLGNLPTIEGSINGKKVGVLLDTGAFASSITKDAAERFDLITRNTGDWATGFGGESRVLAARVQELRVGDASVRNIQVRVIGERPMRGVDFILGDDFFRTLDMELDYAKSMVRLFQPQDCGNAVLAYWDANAQQVPMRNENKVVIPVELNGREADALIDTGASHSVVSSELAEKAGLTPQSPGVTSGSCSTGIGAGVVHSWVGRFSSLAISGEKIRDPMLIFSDYAIDMGRRAPDLILGTDFLRAHHVYLARSQKKMYFTYAGGLVFPATPSLDCDERMAGKNAVETRAAYEEALAKDPDDARARAARALFELRDGQAKEAIADLDQVIAKDPGNAVALATRARARATLHDYDGALADSDAAIAHGVRTAQVYVTRAQWKRAQGGCKGALTEYDLAVQLDPRDAAALRGRGFCRYIVGDYAGSEQDHVALQDVRADGYQALWLWLARTRGGHDGRPGLERSLEGLPEGDWPRPVMLYLLGRLDAAALMQAASAGAEKGRKGRECEAHFFMAQNLTAQGKREEARARLQEALDECPRGYYEYQAAQAEAAVR
jgi:predicted aspartyl protease/tetratricopeptide (TPR) repeat protein